MHDDQMTNPWGPPTAESEWAPGRTTTEPPDGRASRRERRTRVRATLALVVFCGLAGVGGGMIGSLLAGDAGSGDAGPVTQVTSAEVAVADDAEAPATRVAAVASRIADSVVTISSEMESGLGSGRSTGTGVVLTSDGEILTNAHVVEGAVGTVVRFAGRTEPVTARVLAADPGNDLALIKIDARDLVAATFAAPGSVRVGDQVVAIGYALALDGGPTVTTGIVSALQRTIVTESGALNSLIQTDAAISSGNSGGPLLNMRGEVVGINTAVARGDSESAANNIGFSISVDEVLRVVGELRAQARGEVRREGFLGVGLTQREDGGQGAIITNVQPGSPAAKAGIREGDIVVSVDDQTIDGQAGLVAAIRDASPGQTVEIVLSRDGEILTVSTTLVARESE
jgi:putative serine protease PepD